MSGLVDFFTGQDTSGSINTRGFVSTKVIPVGSFLVLAVGCTGASNTATATDNRGNTYTNVKSQVNAGVTVNVHLIACRVTTQINVGSTITVTLQTAVNSQRWNFCAFWFDDIDSAPNGGVTAGQEQSSQFASSTAMAVQNDRNLVVSACCYTGAGDPATATSGATLITSMITTAGSAERGMAVAYEYETAATRSATFTLAASATVVTVGATFDATAISSIDNGRTASDDVMDALANAGFNTGSLRDRQMAQHIAAGRVTGSYKDRSVVAGNPIFPK